MLPLLISDAKDKHPTFIFILFYFSPPPFFFLFFPRFFFSFFFPPPKIGGAAFTALRPYRRRIRYTRKSRMYIKHLIKVSIILTLCQITYFQNSIYYTLYMAAAMLEEE